jgi:hypothetical protein
MKEIKNCPGYFVTVDGKVYSSWTKRIGLGYKKGTSLVVGDELKEVSYEITKTGYVRVSLKRKRFLVHRLVAETYIPNKNNKLEINHKDKNKKNNCVYNLEWVTPQQNIEHSHAKHWKVFDTSNNQIYNVFNLSKWCRENELDVRNLHSTIKNNSTHKGYKIITL